LEGEYCNVRVDIAIALTYEKYFFAVNVVLLAIKMELTLQILHASDFESGIDAAGTSPQTSDAVHFPAVLNSLI